MAKYEVLVLIDCTRLVTVEADSEEEAYDAAMDAACGSDHSDVDLGDPIRVCEINGRPIPNE